MRSKRQRGGNPPKEEIIPITDLGTPDPPVNRKKLKESDEFEVRWDKIYTPLKVQPTELKDPEKKEKYGNIGINWGKDIHRPRPPPQPENMRRTTSWDDINYLSDSSSDSSGGSTKNNKKSNKRFRKTKKRQRGGNPKKENPRNPDDK